MSQKAVFPLRVILRSGSRAEKRFYAKAGLPEEIPTPADIAGGIPPSPRHDLKFHGGKTIQNLQFKNFYVGGSQSWDPGDIQNIDSKLAAAMSDEDLNNVMMQYFGNRPITSALLGSQILAGQKPAIVSQGDVEAMVTSMVQQGQFSGVDFGSTLINFMLPSGTILNTNEAPTVGSEVQAEGRVRRGPVIPHEEEDDSTNGLGGYHGSVHINTDTVYYAVGVYSENRPDGTVNGIPVFDRPWKNVVATFYHELNEARTDPDVEDAIKTGSMKVLGWTSAQGEECGDFPVFEANPLTLVFQEVPLTEGSGTVPVQFQYSNAVHGPEGPIPEPHRAHAAHGGH